MRSNRGSDSRISEPGGPTVLKGVGKGIRVPALSNVRSSSGSRDGRARRAPGEPHGVGRDGAWAWRTPARVRPQMGTDVPRWAERGRLFEGWHECNGGGDGAYKKAGPIARVFNRGSVR